jgi:glucokinase
LHLSSGYVDIDTKAIMHWIKDGQPSAMKVFNRQMDYLAAGLESIFNLVEPDLVVLGGEISKLGGILTRTLQKRLRHPLRITTSALHNDAGLIGAALLALEQR